MSPRHPARRGLLPVLAVLVLVPAAARAQTAAEAAATLGAAGDPLARTARPLGMGRLTLVLPDANNRITLWDFAGNPTGILEADSVSSLELRPTLWTTSSARDAYDAGGVFERQTFAGNHQRAGVEAWRRSGGTTAFGVIGEFAAMRTDRAYSLEAERRTLLSRPVGSVVLNGRVPFLAPERLRYAIRATFGTESLEDEYRGIVRNAAGEYVNKTGPLLGPPNRFDPDEVRVRAAGGGLALSYGFGPWLTLAAGGDVRIEKIRSDNEGDRYLSEYEEDRPYGIGQASLVGRAAGLEYGADARLWSASSNATYVFTGSAGIGAIPIIGRGDMYDREEEGRILRGRARWAAGPLELGAAVRSHDHRTEILPPPDTDRTSLNAYLRELFTDPRADSIALRDSIVHEVYERKGLELGAGFGWRLWPGAAFGAELNVWTDDLETRSGGGGPEARGWDVRGGVEWPCAPALTGRAGYIFRKDDLDDLTELNEYVSHAVTAGAGYQPPGARWRFESGYLFSWGQADFGSPSRPRFTRQQMATQVRWSF